MAGYGIPHLRIRSPGWALCHAMGEMHRPGPRTKAGRADQPALARHDGYLRFLHLSPSHSSK